MQMKKTKLQTRFFVAYLLLALFVVGVFSTFFYRFTSNILIEKEIDAIVLLTSSIKAQTDQAIEAMDTVSINIGYSNIVKDKLQESFILKSDENATLADKKSALSDLAQIFVSINGADTKVDQIRVYDFAGNMISVGFYTNTYEVDLESLDWLEPVIKLNGSKLISLPYTTSSVNKTSSDWYVSLYRLYFNKYGQAVGTVETVKTSKSIFKSISSYEVSNDHNRNVYIYNQDGDQIYPYRSDEDTVSYDYFDMLDPDTNHVSFQVPDTNTTHLLAYEVSNYTGWTYITVQPQEIVLEPVRNFFELLVAFILIMCVICAIISFYLASNLTKPIKKLGHLIEKVELDNLGQINMRELEAPFEEFSQLTKSYQNMSINLKASVDELVETRQQELKSRSLALQSQMNPHFYYNSLSSIIVLAENGKTDDIALMCRNLTQIMRYITKNEELVVTLREEIDYIQKYLYCMKIRYQDSLNYTFNVDDALLDIKVPKLIIQPLVENALKYGTNCNPPWNLTIQSVVSEAYWRIDVIDSGEGFTDEALKLVGQRITKASEKLGMPDIQIDGMGILNVYLRWKLYCQDKMIFAYGNTEDHHGITSIGSYK